MALSNRAGLQQFLRAVRLETKRLTQTELVVFQKKVVFEALRRVIQKTPVDTGHARSNWQVTIGAPATSELGGTSPPNIAAAVASLASLGAFQVVYIANSVPYILILEEGQFVPPDPGPSSDPRAGRSGRVLVSGGFSTQAPQGIVAVTVAELNVFFPGARAI